MVTAYTIPPATMSSNERCNPKSYTSISINLHCSNSYKIVKESEKLKETVATTHAMLNGKGGQVKLLFTFETEASQILTNVLQREAKNSFSRKIEQRLVSTAGTLIASSNIQFKEHTDKIIVEVKGASARIINSYNLFLPTDTQVVLVNPQEPPERVRDAILGRRVVKHITKLGSHCKNFFKGKDCGVREGKVDQVKSLKSTSGKRTTLGDRIIGNKFRHYVSAFANLNGGTIYYGVNDGGVVEGELVPNDKSVRDIRAKVEKTIKKMIWPRQIGQPTRGVHWEIFFEPVKDDDSNTIPSTFVIVVYIAPCLGGVFTEEPECYEMVEGKVTNTWKTIIRCDDENCEEEIPSAVQHITWSSAGAERRYIKTDELLMDLINNARWKLFAAKAKYLEDTFPEYVEIQLIVLSKRVISWCRRGYSRKAKRFLLKYYEVLSTNSNDTTIFEAIGLYLEIALQRVTGAIAMEVVTEALSKAECIPHGTIPASILILVASSSIEPGYKVAYTTGNEQQQNQVFQKKLCEKALEHLQKAQNSSVVKTDLKRKAHINLAQQHLGCSLSGNSVSNDLKDVNLDRANISITAVQQSITSQNAIALYREIQFNNVLSIMNYRYSQVDKDLSTEYLKEALSNCRKAKQGAEDCSFHEMTEWSKTCEGRLTEELVCAHCRKSRY